jgi:hypothetical protein
MTRYWGPCTWYLFHTLAEKVKDEHFSNLKNSLISIIKRICSNLPCPECAGHAQHKLSSLNINNIRGKRDLQMMLLSFHNEVNKRLKKPLFTEQQMDEKYKTANTGNIIQYFLQTWQKPNSNPKLLTVSLHKNQAIKAFTNWWSENYIHFKA